MKKPLTISTYEQPTPDLNGKSVLITGGTGTFGRQFVRTVMTNWTPRRVVVFSRDELKQSEMQAEFPSSRYRSIRYFIGDVRDADRLQVAMRDIEYVIHAAALKQVPAAEYNPFECVRTNIHGAENVVNAAIRAGVRRVIALSSDKAANPINLYGATKLASDKIFIAANHMSGLDGTRFSVVRYGNVLGSRGSVVPFFQSLISQGQKTLPITDARMTRFWITIDQGVRFVLECLERASGGEIFVPKLPSMRIIDLAEAMLPGCQTKIIGIRPGEKLHEVMIPRDDARYAVEFGDFYVIRPSFHDWSEMPGPDLGSAAKTLPDGFEYASNNNQDWLSPERMRALLGGGA
jgi:UDP-N-acetylglucosamine 4,6-dehydratase